MHPTEPQHWPADPSSAWAQAVAAPVPKAFLLHLDHVAPQGSGIDLRPFWTLGVAALMRDLEPGDVDTRVFKRVMGPFIEVCGPLPDQLL